ncbi:MAG: hypothetical protein ACYDDA_06755 [Acidiferrobacteraceae bacterium]
MTPIGTVTKTNAVFMGTSKPVDLAEQDTRPPDLFGKVGLLPAG